MSDNLKPKKIDENTIAYHDKLTNDPVAIVRRIKPRYGNKSTYVASWHPVMKELYPDETSTFKHMNIGEADSASTIQNFISGSYERLLDPKHANDLLKVKYVGDMSKEWNDPETVSYSGSPVTRHYSQYHVFDNDNNHVATINVDKGMTQHIGVMSKDKEFRSKRDAHIDYIGQKPTEDQERILDKKNPGFNPVSLLGKVHQWQTLKGKEPRFVGVHHYSDDHSQHMIYSTKLSPEDATREYVNHLKNSEMYRNHTFEQISPTLAIARLEPGQYNNGKTEFIDGSTAGKISHTRINNYSPDSYHNKKLNSVIE